MEVKALRRLVGEYGQLEKNEVRDLPKWQAMPLIALGYVVEHVVDATDEAEPKPRKQRRRR